ncbi:MAG: ABC transporter ATP-binding protein [Thaumarchaeota archaeon]|nr:ABC transporter ATP-binding protein [Nitrososphaerota archaeon]
MEELALQATSLSKSFGRTRAVDGISLTMRRGEILGLLGPNGSGKSTTMKMILGILRPDSGTISAYGIDVAKDPMGVKKVVGYVPETPQIYEFLTGVEYLDFIADMYAIPNVERKERIGQFLEGLQLKGHENDLIGGYSQGMKQKIAIIAALLHRPKILVMDEALNGLDPRSAKLVKDLLRKLASEGVSVLFSTHVLEIAEALCDQVAIMYQGKIVANGNMADLRSQAGLPGSTLEEVFLKITGTGELDEIVKELSK